MNSLRYPIGLPASLHPFKWHNVWLLLLLLANFFRWRSRRDIIWPLVSELSVVLLIFLFMNVFASGGNYNVKIWRPFIREAVEDKLDNPVPSSPFLRQHYCHWHRFALTRPYDIHRK